MKATVKSTARDEEMMRRCLELGRRGEGRTAPDPMAGCVVVDRGGRVVGESWSRGGTHAEVDVTIPDGATVHVSVEPCPTCARLIAGAARVVVGMPLPGSGVAWLARRVAVTRGVLRAECEEENRAFLTRVRRERPWFTLKAAATLDGKVATWRGESKWVTGEEARHEGHRMRDSHDAILVGVGTVLADDPSLTVRGVAGGRDPVRVVVDSRLRARPGAAFLRARGSGRAARVIVAATRAAPAARERRLAGAEVWRLPARRGRVDLAALAARLAADGVSSVLVEGGPTIHGALLEAGLADELRLFLAPTVLGGTGRRSGPGWAGGRGADRLADAWRMEFVGEPRRLGDDLLLTLRRSPGPGRGT